MRNTIHIIGAGIAGLTAGVYLSGEGRKVHIYESSKYAGGRCRSFIDKKLGCEIDNANHILLGINQEALNLIREIRAIDEFVSQETGFPFIDIKSGDKWDILPKGFLNMPDRIPKTRFIDYLRSMNLLFARKNQTVAQNLQNTGELYNRMWNPMAVSILNTPSTQASAQMFRNIIFKLFMGGGMALKPYTPKKSWGEALIDPCLAYLEDNGAKIEYNQLLKKITFDGKRAKKLHFAKKIIKIAENDKVIIAIPSFALATLIDDIAVPQKHNAIVNVHFKTTELSKELQNEGKQFWGVIGGVAEWFFVKNNIISSTTSAANDLLKMSEQKIAESIWKNLQKSLDMKLPMPEYRVLIEKRATFAYDTDVENYRPNNDIGYNNLLIAGDYTNTALPATIESAVVSGKKAANIISNSVA